MPPFVFFIGSGLGRILGLASFLTLGSICLSGHNVQAQGGPGSARGPDFWQPGRMQRPMWGPRSMLPEMRARMQRHWTYMHAGIPAAYQGTRSTTKSTAVTIAEGGVIYAKHCSSCHGKKGMGDGDAGKSLSPSPALLSFMIQRPMAVDEYLLWTISVGGKQFGTDMPAFKDTLDRESIWKMVAYMRSGFPETKVESK